ncbi:MAG TPA: hypothetical protein P5262_02045 [Candidatus Moranbacteria bacterium]|nr:hypothetical protein [Candidatus Moranbacteria bacterium]
MNKNNIAALILVVGVLAAGIWYVKFGPKRQTDIGLEGAKTKVTEFVEKNLVQPGTKVDVTDTSLENGLYKVSFKVGGQSVDTYITKDGSKFFPQAMDMSEVEKQAAESGKKEEAKNAAVPKTDVPEVNLFVMSYCPYGTQAEKGILPVLETLGNKIKFTLKFVDYAMHDKKELDENLRQYCIQKNQPAKLASYLTCFLKKGQGTENDCMTSAGVNAAQVVSCISATDTQLKITESYNDKSKWSNGTYPPFDVDKTDVQKYGVQGSPTLVVNGQAASAGRDSASILKTICGAFNNPPVECGKELSSASPSPGFGEGTVAGSNSDASCGN